MIWIITKSTDECEWSLTTAENMVKCPKLQVDTEGDPMLLVKAFEAESYEEAKKEFEKYSRKSRW